mgnify:CR=1 FL=1
MEDYANTITAERVKRVIKGYGSEAKPIEGTGGDFSFYELKFPLDKYTTFLVSKNSSSNWSFRL